MSGLAGMAFLGFLGAVLLMVGIWIGIRMLVRRFWSQEAVATLDRIAFLLVAAGFNVAFWFYAFTISTAGFKLFASAISKQPSGIAATLLRIGGLIAGVPEGKVKAPAPYELTGFIVATSSIVGGHLVLQSLLWLSEWIGHRLSFERLRLQREARQEIAESGTVPYPADADQNPRALNEWQTVVEERADRMALWQVGWRTAERILVVVAAGLVFKLIVFDFDVLLMQLQMAESFGLVTTGGGVVSPADIPPPQELFSKGEGSAAVVMQGLKWFYVAVIFMCAYAWHVAWTGFRRWQERSLEPRQGTEPQQAPQQAQAARADVTPPEKPPIQDQEPPEKPPVEESSRPGFRSVDED